MGRTGHFHQKVWSNLKICHIINVNEEKFLESFLPHSSQAKLARFDKVDSFWVFLQSN